MLFLPIKFKTTVQLNPNEMDARYQERLMTKLQQEYEGICSKYGYIKPNTIEIVKRSCGQIQKAYFNGCIKFEVLCRAEVCNPVPGSIVEAIVKNKNQLGVLAESYIDMKDTQRVPILDIIIPIKSAGIISQIPLEQVQIGETIHVEVMGKKFQMKDKKISIIGRGVVSSDSKIKEVPLEEEDEELQRPEEEEILPTLEEKKGGMDDEDDEEEKDSEEEELSEEEEDDDELEGGSDDDYDDFDGEEEEFGTIGEED